MTDIEAKSSGDERKDITVYCSICGEAIRIELINLKFPCVELKEVKYYLDEPINCEHCNSILNDVLIVHPVHEEGSQSPNVNKSNKPDTVHTFFENRSKFHINPGRDPVPWLLKVPFENHK